MCTDIIEVWQRQGFVSFWGTCRLVVSHNLPPVQSVAWSPSPGVNWRGREADRPLVCSAEVKDE